MLRRHIVLLIAIRPSDGYVKHGGPLGAFSRRAGYEPAPGFTFSLPVIIIPHNTITLHIQLHLQSPLPQLSPVHYTDTHPTRNVVCPSGALIENRPHSTPSIHLVWNPKHVIVQWVGIGTHTQIGISLQAAPSSIDKTSASSRTQPQHTRHRQPSSRR